MARRRRKRSAETEEAEGVANDGLGGVRVGAGIAWVAWAMLMGLFWGQYQLRALHPRFLPFAILTLLLLVSVLFSALLGLRRSLHGPWRGGALFWTLLASIPLFALAAPCEYARRQWQERRAPRNLAMEMAKMVGASLMEGQAAYLYPQRLETRRLVMFYDRLATPRRDAEAMERHIEGLEKRLGRPLRAKIHWARGSLAGQSSLSYYGLALGSAASPADWEKPNVDRHELAHAVIEQQRPLRSDPPALLHEGWAESQSGHTSEELARRALRLRASGESFTLRELTQPRWYHLASAPAYEQGGAFVDFLLRRYGVSRFLQLYNAATPQTFAEDCRHILGADLDALDSQFWQDARRMGEGEKR